VWAFIGGFSLESSEGRLLAGRRSNPVQAEVARGLKNKPRKRFPVLDAVRPNGVDDYTERFLSDILGSGSVVESSRGKKSQSLREAKRDLLFRYVRRTGDRFGALAFLD
jgi:hypothetical protein